jgi:hypothetical protein
MDRCCHVQWKGHLTDPPRKRKKEKKKKEKTSCSTYWVVVQVDDDQSGVIQGAGKKVVAGYTASPEFRGIRSSLH